MKIVFSEDISLNNSGKHKFLNRLSSVFQDMGIKIVPNNGDILLHLGRNFENISSKIKVMRLDGLYFNKDQPYQKRNSKLQKSINKSNAVIYQSIFCKQAYEMILNVDKKNICIFNGADPNEFPQRDPGYFFFAQCNWRPHKRLVDICKSFIYAVDRGLNASLKIAGNVDKPIKHPNIEYTGWMDKSTSSKYLSRALATIHLSWIDWCPNAMVESVVAKCPIIYSMSGGSPEIGNGNGIGIKDTQWDFNPCRLYKPPKLDYDEISLALKEYSENKTILKYDEKFDIRNIANQYIDFFTGLLNEN